MKSPKRDSERPRIDISSHAMSIINDLIERGHFDSVREIIDVALPLLQIKIVNDTQVFAELYEDEEGLKEMTDLQLKNNT